MKRLLIVLVAALFAAAAGEKDFGVGPQYSTTHVYVRPEISLRIGGHLPIR